MASWIDDHDLDEFDEQDLDEDSQDYSNLFQDESDMEEDDAEDIKYVEEDDEQARASDEALSDDNTLVTVIAIYDEDGDEIPMNVTSSPSSDTQRPAKRARTRASHSPDPSGTQPRARSPMCDVVVSVEKVDEPDNDSADNDSITTEDVFHLADEHELFQEEGGETRPAVRGSRSGVRGREKEHMQKKVGARWTKGDKLIHVNVHDDDVSEELREMIMQVVAARETKDKTGKRSRNQKEALNEEFVDAEDGQDEALFAEGNQSSDFEWSSMDTYNGKREKFLPRRTGPVDTFDDAYGAFRQFWDDEILSHIVASTNQHAAKVGGSFVQFARDWYDTNIHELLVLFAFWMMLGIIKMPTTKSCFTTNPLLQTNIFRKMFSRTRYQNLCRALNFSHRTDRRKDRKGRLHCFGPILDHLNSRFKSAYVPSQSICIDESLTMWKGMHSFGNNLKSKKTSRFGVTTFELCESSTGYLWSFFIYLGRSTAYDPSLPSNLPKSTATALTLVRPLLNKGYTLFMDSWFSSPLLARYLKTRKTDCVGTLDPKHRDAPPLVSVCSLKDGQFVARHAGDVTVLAYGDKKQKVTAMSTFHGISQSLTEPKPHRPVQYKPQVILDFKKGMLGVGRKDQMLEPYLLDRKKCGKWSMKFFKRLLNSSILNSRIIVQASTRSSKEHIVFRLELVDQILKEHLQKIPKPHRPLEISSDIHNSHLTNNKHWPEQITILNAAGRISRRRCVWCSHQNHTQQRTSYLCSACAIPLCVEPCFKLYHTTATS